MLHDWNVPKMSELGVKCAGHEGAGVIVKVGQNVKGLAVGQRAGFKPIQNVCHQCDYCKSGRDQYCQKAVFTGGACDGKYSPPTHAIHFGLRPIGSYKQYVVSPDSYTTVSRR